MADLYRPEAGAPVTAEDAEHRGFATSFRGFDPAEVRAYLRRVAETMRALQDEHRRLETRAREAERRAEHPTLDESTLAAALGDEMARILRSAQEAAAEIRGKAESHVEAIAQQARDEGARLTSEAANILEVRRAAAEAEAEQIIRAASEEADRLRSDARAEAETILADSASRAEATVDEAREQRAAVLSDLRRRRRVANTQIEQLRAGRERLLAAYEVVGRTLGEVSDELQRADAEARAAADDVGRRLTAATDPDKVDALAVAAESPIDLPQAPPVIETVGTPDPASGDPEPVSFTAGTDEDAATSLSPSTDSTEGAADGQASPAPALSMPAPSKGGAPSGRPHRRKNRGGRPPQLPAPSDSKPASVPMGAPPAQPMPQVATGDAASPPPPKSPPKSPPAERAPASTPKSETASERMAEPPAVTSEVPVGDGERRESAAADDLFARLRAEREASVAAAEATLGADAVSEPKNAVEESAIPEQEAPVSVDRRLFVARSAACEPLEVQLSRLIKRALQDEQNLALDRLRSTRGSAGVEAALGAEAEHLAGYVAIVQPALTDAAAAGAAATGANPMAAASAVDSVALELATEIVVPLRRRLDERLHEAAAVGDDRATITDRVGAAYRELKAQRVSRLASDWLVVAWSHGAYPTTGGGERVWTVDPEKPCCTDCDDNALAGPVAAGEAFPTGHERPPAHPGCRCVLVSATT